MQVLTLRASLNSIAWITAVLKMFCGQSSCSEIDDAVKSKIVFKFGPT